MIIEGILLNAIVGSVLPVVSDAIGSVIQRLTGGAGALPKNVDDVIKLQQAEIDHLKALQEMDAPGSTPISPWVANLRAAMRPALCVTGFLCALGVSFIPGISPDTIDYVQMIGTVTTTYIFGERFILGRKGLKQ